MAMSWLSRKVGLSHDIFGEVMKARDAQTRWLADLTMEVSEEKGLPVILLGTSFKANSSLEDGSAALLLYQYLCRKGANVLDRYDPHVHDVIRDPGGPYDRPAVFFISTNHDLWPTWTQQAAL